MEKFLISMAMVKVNWDVSQESPIDTYMPLLGYAISQCETDIVTVDEISKTLADMAEIYIPQGAIIALLNRAAKRKYRYVKKENKVYIKNSSALKGLVFDDIRARASRSQNSLRIKFKSYCKETL